MNLRVREGEGSNAEYFIVETRRILWVLHRRVARIMILKAIVMT